MPSIPIKIEHKVLSLNQQSNIRAGAVGCNVTQPRLIYDSTFLKAKHWHLFT